ncbi:SDR family NAD(P)-dependent oxidoreductase [Nocardiopsis sp. JB363]|uniref:SDR family NAD(P)-dependent oxidoreductase n=1 Tax=Nocardiopsis sp. JB363 TaxID=1434837 RepID=UPI00097AE7BD|nr:SDR family NAD(P)-dependent oxidoreductase [Nocardiopsis sp. JB363]SIO84434.1 Malonyl CoA-acyl carrier protein transacylase [Nocardiopsis sp. JB363]
MNEFKREILRQVQSGEITPQQAWAELRRATDPAPPAATPATPTAAPPKRGTGPASGDTRQGEAVAVVGASARYAGAPDLEGYWNLLDESRCSVTEVAPERWDASRYFSPEPGRPGTTYSRWGGFLDGIDRFDPGFFHLSGRAAELMDPQQRLFLEAAWRALEDAGAAGSARLPEHCGVYVGTSPSDYLGEEHRLGPEAEALTMIGNDSAILAARISYLLDLRGPNIALDTACSSSLVAIDLACTSLLSGRTDLAVAGGVCLFVGPAFYLAASQGQMLSPTGACRAFDASADGFVPGEGVGVVVLKRLSDALADGDHIRGVILGSGVNQDGKTNGLTAPSALSQERLEREVYERASVSAESITLVEAHGTGTVLGDPIEVTALERAFRADTDRTDYCALGSVKTNIGHTSHAAGVAGVLKVLLAMEHRRIPASLHFDRLSPSIELDGSPFYVADEPRDWQRSEGTPRRAVVSSFGYSGTNAHLVMEEPPEHTGPERPPRAFHLTVVSARTPEALDRVTSDLAEVLRGSARGADLHDVAFTLAQGRRHWDHRAAYVVRDTAELARLLDESGAGEHRAGDGAPHDLRDAARAYVESGRVEEPPGGWRGRIVPLPGHPFDRQSYWSARSESGASDTPTASPEHGAVLGADTGFPLNEVDRDAVSRPGARLFRVEAAHWWVDGHRVDGRPVLAAATTLAMVFEAARRCGLSGALTIRDVRWVRPIESSAAGVELRFTEDGDGLRFRVGSADGDEPGCTGRVQAGTGPAPARTSPTAGEHTVWDTSHTPEECYRWFASAGLVHGRPFRALDWLRTGDGEVVAGLDAEGRPLTGVDPGLLDSAFQAVAALRGPGGDPMGFPVSLDRFELGVDALTAATRARIVRRGDAIDIDLTDSVGRVLGTLSGLAIVSAAQNGTHPVLLHEEWRAAEVDGALCPEPSWRLTRYGVEHATTGVQAAEAALTGTFGSGDVVVDVARGLDPLTLYAHAARLLRVAADRESADRLCVTFTVDATEPAAADALAALGASVTREHPLVIVEALRPAADPGLRPVLPAQRGGSLRRTPAGLERRGLAPSPEPPATDRPRPGTGTYVVTGGTGTVGSALAADLVAAGGHVTVLSRSEPTRDTLDRIGPPDRVAHVRADVTDRDQVCAALDSARRDHGAVRGIVHAAGTEYSRSFAHEDGARVDRVLSAKITGTALLDEVTADDDLDLFVTCSSLAGITGNRGQAAYSYANAALTGLTRARAEAVRAGTRSGRTIALAWGPWTGGMAARTDADHGLTPLTAVSGAAAWRSALTGGQASVAVLGSACDVDGVLAEAAGTQTGPAASRTVPVTEWPGAGPGNAGDPTPEDVAVELRDIFADELRIPADNVRPDTRLEELGIESVMIAGITARLLAVYAEVPKTLFFEHRTVGGLTDALTRLPRRTPPVAPAHDPGPADGDRLAKGQPPATAEATTLPWPEAAPDHGAPDGDRTDGLAVAVVGLAGRYPMAEHVGQLWENLRSGRDCVTQIPPERWDLDGFYAPDRAPLRSYSKWGGFVDGIDRFDPTFFRIAPNEAAMLDPQERMFLQVVWETIEDAGLTPRTLARRTGTWVGVMYGDYQLLGAAPDGRIASSSYASIANRVSYTLDLHGPSLAVDSMCSSSLTALHLALQSLRSGEVDAAIVGGVNLHTHPRKYLQLSLGGFASSDGRCRSFGEGGDGYVPGEGIGAVLLKPLADALRDGDPVQAVIRGSAVNHGGRANGYTVPDPNAQAGVIGDALDRSGVDANTVSYVEAHGTGTALGDPVEVRALARHFGPEREVALGSVKSNLGHLESAAGIVALTKVVIQLRHRELVPSLHGFPANPDIDFDATGVRVTTSTTGWTPAVGAPRRALISSFGAGGTNASVIVDEAPPRVAAGAPPTGPADGLLVLSADSAEQLREATGRLLGRLREHGGGPPETAVAAVTRTLAEHLGVGAEDIRADDEWTDYGLDALGRSRVEETVRRTTDPGFVLGAGINSIDALTRVVAGTSVRAEHEPDLVAIAHTLRTGRVERPERLAIAAATVEDAVRALSAWLDGRTTGDWWAGRAPSGAGTEPRPVASFGSAQEIAVAWVEGTPVDWGAHTAWTRVAGLPTYPFRRDHVWLDDAEPVTFTGSGTPATVPCGPDAAVSVEHGGGATDPVQGRVGTAEPESFVPSNSESADPSTDTVVGLLRDDLVRRAAARIGLDPERLDPHVSLGDYGYESLAFQGLAEEVRDAYSFPIDASVFYETRGVGGLAEWLVEEEPAAVRRWASSRAQTDPGEFRRAPDTLAPGHERVRTRPPGSGSDGETGAVAVVGLSGRFPMSPDASTLWNRLRDDESLLTETPAHRWDWRALGSSEDANIYRWGGYLDNEDHFDAAFFGIAAEEADFIDPQQRLLLEESWAALENAGYAPSSLAGGQMGVFAGVQFRDYQHLLHEAKVVSPITATGNEDTFAVNRISYLLDLHGPSEVVNTACASSLVAVHRAIRALRSRECTMALAGGVALNLTPYALMALDGMNVVSPNGQSCPLESRANGYVKGEGVGMVVLRPLADAVRDGDHIHAVLRGSATNHGGRATTITSPNSRAQSAVIVAAVEDADVPVDSIGYVEMHGTGTYVGDPVEVRSLGRAFQELARRQGADLVEGACGLGSGKGGFGHLEPASGIAGLFRVIGALRYRELFGMPDFKEVNPGIPLDGSPFSVVDTTRPWTAAVSGAPLRAGLSSFGIGGVNAHVVVEEAPQPGGRAGAAPARPMAFPFSAKSTEALRAVLRRMRAWLDDVPGGVGPAQVSATTAHGRDAMPMRAVVVAEDFEGLRAGVEQLLAAADPADVVSVADGGWADRELEAARAWADGGSVVPGEPLERRVELPSYPFERTPHWFAERRPIGAEPDKEAAADPVAPVAPSSEAAVVRPAETPSSTPAAGGAAPGTVVRLREVVAEIVGVGADTIPDNATFREVGVDSLMSIRIIEALHEEFSEDVPYSALTDHPSVAELAAFLAPDETVLAAEPAAPTVPAEGAGPASSGGRSTRKGAGRTSRGSETKAMLLPFSRGGDGPPSFWVPGAVGFAAAFETVATRLGRRYPLYAFQARGTDGRSMPQLWDQMVEDYTEAILRIQPEGPYFLGGHSFGGLTAMELARRLQERGEQVDQLVMIDTFPPTQEVVDRHRGDYNDAFIVFYLANVLVDAEQHPERTIREDDLAGVPRELHLPTLARLVHQRTGGQGRMEDVYHYLRGGLTMSEHSAGLYQQAELRPYDASDVLFIRALDGFVGRSSEVYWERVDLMQGYDYVQPWRDNIEGRVDLVDIDEDHLHILDGDAAETVADEVRRRLDAVHAARSGSGEVAAT